MEDYFKDFEFFGFKSEFHMALELVNEYSNTEKYDEEFRQKPMVELIEHWVDTNSEKFGLRSPDNPLKKEPEKNLLWIGNKLWIKPGIFSKQS